MSLDKFKSIIEEKGRFVPENELEIFQQYDLRTSFGSFIHDTIRVIIYDASNNPLPQGKFGLVRYINKTDQPQYYKRIEGPTKRSRRNYTIDVKKLIKDAGYNIGIFTVEMMFVNNRLGTQTKPNRVWIQEISPSRTEVRVLPFDVGDTKLNGLSLQEIIDERYKAFLDHEQFKEDIYEAIEPFLDLITTDDIRQLMVNQVGQTVFDEIIKQYFKRSTTEFDKIIDLLILKFKEAVRYELMDKDSLIGPSYNVINPNFGKDKPTVRVSIDFPNFCFNKLLESLEVYIPKLVDVPETEFDQEVEEFPFPRVRPRINVPTQRDPNPTTTTTTTTLPPGGTTTTTTQGPNLPKIQFDRGQGKFIVKLYSNQPKNIVSRRTEDGRQLFIEYTGETTLTPVTVRQYDIDKESYVPKDLNFQFKKFDTTNESQWDEYNEYLKLENEQLIRTFNWTDAERSYAPLSPKEPIIPIPGTKVSDNPTWGDDYNSVVPNRGISYPWGVTTYDPTDDYPIPFYYVAPMNGDEKNISIFNNNRLELSCNRGELGITCSTQRLSSAILEYPDYWGRGHNVTNYSYSTENETWEFDGYYDWDTGVLLSKTSDFSIIIKKDINIFIKWKRTSIPIHGSWVLRGQSTGQNNTSKGDFFRQYFTYAPFREIPAGSGLGAIPTPIYFGGTGPLKYIYWSPQPELWTSRPEWKNLVKITDPTKGGLYKLTDTTKQFLSDKETFSRFEF